MKAKELVTCNEPNSPISEAYRTLRTNILYSSFDGKVKTILVTSSGSGEGKTTTSANLAVVMAQSGNKTLLIDCDQRKPKVHKFLGISNSFGLSDILLEQKAIEKGIQKTGVENLQVITSGTRPPNPAELLGSAKMGSFIEELKNKYDFIILDTPPIVMVTDAQLLSKHVDGCVLVVSSGEAEKELAIKAKDLLEKVQAKILGVVLNKIDLNKHGHKQYHYKYEYGEKTEKTKKRKGLRKRKK